MPEVFQQPDFCTSGQLFRLFILHGAPGKIQHYPGDTPDHHPRASEQIRYLCRLRIQPLRSSHLLRETPDVGRVFRWRFGTW